MFQWFFFVPHIAKPSWCLLVMVMYLIPAALARDTHSAASNSVGLNRAASGSYSAMVIFLLFMTHSPSPSTLYTPQWMNRPNLEFWNHSRAFRFDSEGW